MKGHFSMTPELSIIEDILNKKKDFVVFSVSTSGIDNTTYNKHLPIRAAAQHYVFNSSYGKYELQDTFDKLIACDKEIIDYSMTRLEKYNPFTSAKIDREKYLKGEGVLSQEEFKKEFYEYFEPFKVGKVPIITNNFKHSVTYLDKIGCGELLTEKRKENEVADQTEASKEYVTSIGRDEKKYYLGDIMNIMEGKPENAPRPNVSGTVERCKIIADFVIYYGREKGFLIDERTAERNKQDIMDSENFKNEGKEKYRNSSLEEKLNTLISKKVIVPDMINDPSSDCALNHFYEMYSKKNGNKGFTVLMVATTGFDAGDVPIQVAIQPWNINDDGGCTFVSKGACVFNVQADSYSLKRAIEIKEGGGFDAFAYAGIKLEDYKLGKKVFSEEQAVSAIRNYFEDYSLNDYPLLVNGTSRNKKMSLAGAAISKISSLPICEAPFIDFTQVIKEYFYAAYNDQEKYSVNAMLPNKEVTPASFSLEAIVMANGSSSINGAKLRCGATAYLAGAIGKQYVNEIAKKEDMVIAVPSAYRKKDEEEEYTEEDAETLIDNVTNDFVEDENETAEEIEEKEKTTEKEEDENDIPSDKEEDTEKETAPLSSDTKEEEGGAEDKPSASLEEKKPIPVPVPVPRPENLKTKWRKVKNDKAIQKEETETPKEEVKEEPKVEPKEEIKEESGKATREEIKTTSDKPVAEQPVKEDVKPITEVKENVSDIPVQKSSDTSALENSVQKLVEVIDRQNALLNVQYGILSNIAMKQMTMLESLIKKNEQELNFDYSDRSQVSGYIDVLKESIALLTENVNPKARENLYDANDSLSESQKIINGLEKGRDENKKGK